jgi:pimeloyl-ACP methyl ester carboxylesterase
MIGRLGHGFSPWGDVWLRSGWRVQVHCVSGAARVLDPRGRGLVLGRREDCIALAAQSAPSANARRGVVLLHGMWNGPGMMLPLAAAFEAQGWAVANPGYPSTRRPLAAHGAAAAAVAQALAEDGAREVSFIGHSLGGLVARTAMAAAPVPGRLVLLGSPARGSMVAQRFHNVPGYGIVCGDCGKSVTPGGAATVPMPVTDQVFVIAGGTGRTGYNPLMGEDNDGLITVAETRLPGYESRFRRVRALHRSLPLRREVIEEISNFLK